MITFISGDISNQFNEKIQQISIFYLAKIAYSILEVAVFVLSDLVNVRFCSSG